jgi:hypothetical protein
MFGRISEAATGSMVAKSAHDLPGRAQMREDARHSAEIAAKLMNKRT